MYWNTHADKQRNTLKKYTEIHRIKPKYSKKCPEKDRNVCWNTLRNTT